MLIRKLACCLVAVVWTFSFGLAKAEGALDLAQAAAQYPQLVVRQGKPQMQVALTFDDGPDGHYTSAILDILKEKQAPATFFVVGYRAKAHPDMIKRIIEEGHTLANHSWNHPDMSRLGSQNITNQLAYTDNVLENTTGTRTHYFRPPYGAMNGSVISVANQLGYKVILWSVDPQDWRGYGPEKILQRVVGAIHPGAIVLQHCTNNGTLYSLRSLIDKLRAMGYQLVTLEEMLEGEMKIPIQLLVNGQALQDLANAPYQTPEGISMAPLQVVLQALGLSESYQLSGDQVIFNLAGQEQPKVLQLTKPASDISKVFVPLRALAETLNLQLGWDEGSKTVTLNQPPPPPVQQVSRGMRDPEVQQVAAGETSFNLEHWLCAFVI